MIDTNAAIRQFLAAQAGLVLVVGTDIYWPRLDRDFTIKQALSFVCTGGGPDASDAPIVDVSVAFHCWGASPEEAREVYRALYDAFHGIENQDIAGSQIYFATLESGGQDVVDPDDPTWFFVLASYRVLLRAT